MTDNAREQQDDRRDRVWASGERWRVYAVNRPMTFGHSQLVWTSPLLEPDAWLAAGYPVSRCLRIMGDALPRVAPDHLGAYQRTLVLRVSARNGGQPFRLHLVPLFAAHEAEAAARHERMFGSPEGGLIGWLGERETLADARPPAPVDELARIVEALR